MIDIVREYSSLPNLHPALVHFPLALLPTGLVFEAVLLARRGKVLWLDKAAAAIYAGAALGTGLAYWAGRQAADSLAALEPQIQFHINDHSDWAAKSLWATILVLGARICVTLWDKDIRRIAPRALLFVAGIGVAMTMLYTSDLGGGLVYQHGVGVARADGKDSAIDAETAASISFAEVEPSSPATDRVLTEADGSLHWRPLARDADALGSVLTPAPGTDLEALSWIDGGDEAGGLGIGVDGEAVLFLPGLFGDVQVEAQIDLADFAGEVSLLHHARGTEEFGFLTVVAPAGEFQLGSNNGKQRMLDSAAHALPDGTANLTVSAIGRHLKGYLGETNVVHGHEPAPGDGYCGLALRGQGSVRILSMTVTPVKGG